MITATVAYLEVLERIRNKRIQLDIRVDECGRMGYDFGHGCTLYGREICDLLLPLAMIHLITVQWRKRGILDGMFKHAFDNVPRLRHLGS